MTFEHRCKFRIYQSIAIDCSQNFRDTLFIL